MRRPIRYAALGVVLLSATVITSAVAVQPETVPAKPAPPPKLTADNLKSELWVQTSPEFVATCLQIYRLAGDQVERSVKTLGNGACNDPRTSRVRPLAVILDLDETVLDNGAYQTYLKDTNQLHDDDLFMWFVSEHYRSILLIPGAKEFIARIEALGVTPIYITNRVPGIRQETIATLAQWGINTAGLEDPMGSRMLMQGKQRGKTLRRNFIAGKYHVVANIGDQMNDFIDNRVDKLEHTAEKRDGAYDYSENWGTRWFILPNPQYGSWLGAAGDNPEAALRRHAR